MISMVADQSARARSGRTFEQRYNVAFSRARDRMYVFRSFDKSDISEIDLRARVLEHLDNPLGFSVEQVDDLRELCESDFERNVYDFLTLKGYRVQPQVRAGKYRIDLVVEGENEQRLAIECDGDRYHGIDRWMDDLTRQRILERMGWRFWRCWASSWVANKTECIEDLLAELDSRGILPITESSTSTTRSTSLVERRTIEPPEMNEEGSRSTQVTMTMDTAQPERCLEDGVASATTSHPSQSQSIPNDSSSLNLDPPEGIAERSTEHIESEVNLGRGREIGLYDHVEYLNTDQPNEILKVQIVREESNPHSGTVNFQTPLADALLGAEEDELVEAHLPMGTTKYRIVKIHSPNAS